MKAYVLGNPLVKGDSLPVLMIPEFRKAFPEIEFSETDPTEEFTPEEGSVIIDTVAGITECTWFNGLDSFALTAHVTVHDYDLYLHLRLLEKLGRLHAIRIFGIPVKPHQSRRDITASFGKK